VEGAVTLFEVEGSAGGARDCWWPLEAGRGKKQILPGAS
jgi:hypothetical protein